MTDQPLSEYKKNLIKELRSTPYKPCTNLKPLSEEELEEIHRRLISINNDEELVTELRKELVSVLEELEEN